MFLLSLSISSENVVGVYTGQGCVPFPPGCVDAAYSPGLDASCIHVRALGIGCHINAVGCEYEFEPEGTWCSVTGTCCSGKCGVDPRTDTQCQDANCGALGWTASNKPDGTACTYSGKPSSCLSGVCQPAICGYCTDGTPCGSCSAASPGQRCNDVGGPVGALMTDPNCATTCPDGTSVGNCCSPGKRCTDVGGGNLQCKDDGSCATCVDNDGGDNTNQRGTCTDNSGGVCSGSGCTDTCSSNSVVTEYSCSGATCNSKQITCPAGTYCNGGQCTAGGGGGCAWWSSTFNVCASGCPSSYPNKQMVCCDTIGYSECNGRNGCASYNPIKGETPCCTAGGYETCTKTQTCTPSGCVDICSLPDKSSNLYCDRCAHCNDGILNCGEPTIDKCGLSCTMPYTGTCISNGYGYGSTNGVSRCAAGGGGGWTCTGDATCCTGGADYIRQISCSSGEYGCLIECQRTYDVFNPASCNDGVQGCGEACVDGGGQCNTTDVKESDNSYLAVFDPPYPPALVSGLLFINISVDAESWNCGDGLDNDHDCLIDCEDPDCLSALSCTDKTPPTTTLLFNHSANASGYFLSDVSVRVVCTDDSSGCDSTSPKYRINNGPWTIFTKPINITEDGNYTFDYYSIDILGNVEPVKTYKLKFDELTPITTISFNPPLPNAKGYYLNDVTATMSCADVGINGSGCNNSFSPQYRINNGSWTHYTGPFNVGMNGVNKIEYYSVDIAGNEEIHKLNIIKIAINPITIIPLDYGQTIIVGDTGRISFKVKNLFVENDNVLISIKGAPTDPLNNWIWVMGHKDDKYRRNTTINLNPGNEKAEAADIFGGKILSGGQIFVKAESELTGYSKEIEFDINIEYPKNGLVSQTPEFNWIAYTSIALLGALILL